TFVATHYKDGDFKEGLRRYAQYRDLGIAAATNGLAQAHVIRLVPPCDPAEVSKEHYHDVTFQMIYVLKGWMKGEYEGAGVVTMREGSCWLQPPKIKHVVLDYSDDCELLEIIMPAEFGTVELERDGSAARRQARAGHRREQGHRSCGCASAGRRGMSRRHRRTQCRCAGRRVAGDPQVSAQGGGADLSIRPRRRR